MLLVAGHAVEAFEDAVPVVGRDPGAFVADGETATGPSNQPASSTAPPAGVNFSALP